LYEEEKRKITMVKTENKKIYAPEGWVERIDKKTRKVYYAKQKKSRKITMVKTDR
jgi:hypothetical protein